MRGLIIREPWISFVVAGQKPWEIRSRKTNIREKIALIRSQSGLVVGSADLVDCIAVTKKELLENLDKHRMSRQQVLDLFKPGSKYRNPYAWVLHNSQALAKPKPYTHPSGAVIWVTLP